MIHELSSEVDRLLRIHQSVSLTDDVEDYKLPLWEMFFTHDLSPFICDPSHPLEEDDDPKMQKLFRAIEEEVAARGPPPKGKPMDVKVLCNDLALGHLRFHQGLDYEFVGYASYVILIFSRQYGDGLHLNFFARPKGAPCDSPPVLMFVDVANGDPQIIVRCAPVKHKDFSPGDEDKPITHTVYHPDGEFCVYCEPSKYGPVSGIYQVAPPLM